MKNLEPRPVWAIFDEITRVSRPSKNEGAIVAWLVEFAKKHDLEYQKDAIGNVVIRRPASPGMEGRPTVVLQNHVDMVCERNADALNAAGQPFDFTRDGIVTLISPDGGWVQARGTTLGADNGMGMALALALLIDPEAELPPLEALFTVDEETGLTGAFNLRADMISGRYLINLDSEDEGEVFIGCAGGVDTLARFDYKPESASENLRFFEIVVSGLLGGHSGDDIEKGRGNSNRILGRLLWSGMFAHSLRVASIDGGNLRNAIPREARAVVGVPETWMAEFSRLAEGFCADITGELAHSDPDVSVSVLPVPAPASVIDADTSRRLVSALIGVPNGPLAMSFAVPGLVETSSNLASVKMEQGKIVVTTSQRSSVESGKWSAAEAVEAVFSLAGARVEHSEGYPGWAPNPDSQLLEITKKAYRELFGREIKVRAIHAGLECGLFLEKYPTLDMISTGPTILGAHSPNERLKIDTVGKTWRLLLEILQHIR
ncbi:MAG: aminoacyl-histidine dipeptidase [Alistipes sp.]|jgi:dipeptidase D|nr:aminoacyl-histidine dipeptidase [Alistipes sp.]